MATREARLSSAFTKIVTKLNTLKSLIDGLSGGSGGSIFPIWAEENSSLGNNTYEWAFGNGANTPAGGGIIIPMSCELIAMTCKCNNTTGTQEIQMVIDGTPNSTYSVTAVSGAGNVTFVTPLSLSAGTRVNFRTVSSGGTTSPNTVCAWFRTT